MKPGLLVIAGRLEPEKPLLSEVFEVVMDGRKMVGLAVATEDALETRGGG